MGFLGMFKGKKAPDELPDLAVDKLKEEMKQSEEPKPAESSEEKTEEKPEEKRPEGGSTPANLTRIATEVDRIKASVEAFGEVRKSFTERFNRTSEQIGELRAMILDRDRTIQQIELKYPNRSYSKRGQQRPARRFDPG